MAPRSTAAELEQRINEIYLLLLRREPYQALVRFGSTKWGVCSRQVDDYIKSARDLMRQDARVEREDAIAEQIAIRKDLYNKAYKDKSWYVAFQIAQDESKLSGLYFDLKDHVKAAIAAGYKVVSPGSPEDKALSDANAGLEFEVEIGEAIPNQRD